MMSRLRFLLWFTCLDLFQHRRARRVSLVLILTIAMVIALALLLPALVLGHQQQRLAQLRRDPLALSLWISGPIPGATLTHADLDRLTTAVRAALPAAEALRGCHAFRALTLDWFDLREPRLSRTVRGRTLAPGDPLLQSCRLEVGRTFGSPEEFGVVVSRRLLQTLHATSDGLPATLRCRFRASDPAVPVLGVLAQPLPGDLDFVLTEAGEERLRSQNADPPTGEVLTGPVPESWRKLRQLPAPVRQWLARCEVRWIGPEPLGEDHVWRLASDGPATPRLSQWRGYLEGLLAHMRQLGLGGEDAVARPRPVGAAVQAPAETPPCTQAVLYLDDLTHLPLAAAAVRAQGYYVDLDVVQQVERLARETHRALLLLAGLVLVLALLLVGNLYIVQDLRAQQKVVEVGLLKALGVDAALLRGIVLLEATLLWFMALALGLLLGWLGGLGIAAAWRDEASGEPLTRFHAPLELLGSLVLASAVLCLVSAWWASRPARKAAPIRSLSGG